MCSGANASLSHAVDAMYDVRPIDGGVNSSAADLSTWWQSVSWYQLGRRPVVGVRLSFGKTFQLQDDVVVTFQSARPQQMTLDKSVDFGRTWSTLQYYNRSCRSLRCVYTVQYTVQ